MIAGVVFDHLAVAGPDRAALVDRYGGDLGGAFVVEGPTAGLQATIVRFANGVKLEAIQPDLSQGEDFLARFLDRHGPGLHHLTYVVADLELAADEAVAAGFELLGSRTTHLEEVFLHPKGASGTVVQLIEARRYSGQAPVGHPLPRRSCILDHITLVVAALDDADRLFVELLGGAAGEYVEDDRARRHDVSWPGPGTIRLVEPAAGTDLRRWLGNRPGAAHHLAFACEDPAGVPGSRSIAEGAWEVAPDANHGVALTLRAHTPPRG